MTKIIRALQNLTDASGDSDLFVAAGTLIEVDSDEGDYLIGHVLGKPEVSFPIMPEEFEPI